MEFQIRLFREIVFHGGMWERRADSGRIAYVATTDESVLELTLPGGIDLTTMYPRGSEVWVTDGNIVHLPEAS